MHNLWLGFRRYAQFSGKSTRQEFWHFVSLTQLILLFLLLPGVYAILLFFHEFINNPRVLDLLFSIPQTPDILYEDLLHEATLIREMFVEDFVSTFKTALICTGIAAVWGAIIAIPTLTITARRLHDAGHSRWWICPLLLFCIPLPIIAEIGFFGSIVTLIFCCRPSQKEAELPPVPPAGTA